MQNCFPKDIGSPILCSLSEKQLIIALHLPIMPISNMFMGYNFTRGKEDLKPFLLDSIFLSWHHGKLNPLLNRRSFSPNEVLDFYILKADERSS